MGLYDRDYTQPESRRQHYDLSQMRFNLPQVTPAVKWLLIINTVVFALSLVPAVGEFLASWLAIDTTTWAAVLQPWRLFTYQFLHKDALAHLHEHDWLVPDCTAVGAVLGEQAVRPVLPGLRCGRRR